MKYNLLPEWHPQELILLVWPHHHSDWKHIYSDVNQTYLMLAKNLANTEKVLIVAYSKEHINQITKDLISCKTNLENIEFTQIQTNDTWIRDYGPLSCELGNKISLLNFQFNGYGEKYVFDLDNQVSKKLSDNGLLDNMLDINLILEGGSIETNGAGTILTTTNCLLDHSRNNQSKEQISSIIKSNLICNEIIWLEHCNLIGDDTDGHIDNFVRFINTETVFYLSCDEKSDPHYDSLLLLKDQLHYSALSSYNLVPIPMPSPIEYEGERLPASYLNFLITNNCIIVPSFNDVKDSAIMEIFSEYEKNLKLIPIDSRVLIRQGGGIHCSTMQIAKNIT